MDVKFVVWCRSERPADFHGNWVAAGFGSVIGLLHSCTQGDESRSTNSLAPRLTYAELESHCAPTSRRAAPAAGTRGRNRRGTGAAPGSRLRRRAGRWFIGGGSRGARPAELRLAVAGMWIEPRGKAVGCAGFAAVPGIDRTQRRNANGIVHTRLALQRANVDEATWIHVDRCDHPRARHWREYRDF